jgi:four helix bundle protein
VISGGNRINRGYWILDGIIVDSPILELEQLRYTVSFKDLEIWKLAQELVIEIHQMTFNELPKYEIYEEGNQIRRSIKAVKSNIVEGYGRRRYKQDFIKFLVYALSSNDETLDHLDTLFRTGSLKDKQLYDDLDKRLVSLGKMIHSFIQTVEISHKSSK